MHIKAKNRKALALFFISALWGCTNPFTTRESQVEKPDVGSETGIYEEPTRAENILVNLSRSIEQKNVQRYMDNFSDPAQGAEKGFTFVGDAAFQDQLIGSWTLSDEETWFRNLIFPVRGRSPVIRFSYVDSLPRLQPISATSFEDSVETDLFRYRFTLAYPDSTQVVEGLARMRLFRSLNTAREPWLIYYWEDRALDGATGKSWTALKIRNR
ncbi:MAG TPA: hypothetical protein ENJ10_09925 [Caldithrix abyssi]|uniref:Uncharacterized protein n=1 Tax=Caldithrix abyssi TaxID=187145 RepID=A0A7V1PUZ3_CALAY|nr:hypothetical protein [Caldithrix abyssi]